MRVDRSFPPDVETESVTLGSNTLRSVGASSRGGDTDWSEATGAPAASVPAATASAYPVEQVTFMAGFKPQADLPFVGVYVAQEKGYFKAQGLDVTIQHATSGEHVQLLATDRIQFSTGTGGDILKRVAQAGVQRPGRRDLEFPKDAFEVEHRAVLRRSQHVHLAVHEARLRRDGRSSVPNSFVSCAIALH